MCALEVTLDIGGPHQQFSVGLLMLPFKDGKKAGLMLTKKVQNAAVIAFFEVDCSGLKPFQHFSTRSVSF